MRRKLIVFDVDGVLLNNKKGGFKDILIILGKGKEVQKIDEEYQRKKYLGPWGLDELSKLYQGFSENELKREGLKYCQQNLMEGAKTLLNKSQKRGYIVGALSSNPQFIMHALARILALDFSEGTRLEFKDGRATGKIKKKVDRYGKAEILKRKREEYGLNHKDVITIGRATTTHLPMTRESGIFIGFDPEKETIEDIAQIIVEKQARQKGYNY